MAAPVSFRFPGVEGDFEGTVANIGMAGMLISGTAPMPAGTMLQFEFRPSPKWHRLSGRGRVVWARPETSEEGEPPGMGVRFTELDERGRRGVRWLIETYQQVGDKPFDTWSVPAQFTRSEPTDGDVLATQEIAPLAPEEPGPRPWRGRAWALLAAGLALVIIIAGWGMLGPQEGGTPAPTPMNAPVAPAETTPPVAEAAPPAADPQATTEAPEIAEATQPETGDAMEDSQRINAVLTDLVGEWAAAWASQDVDRYLAFYAPEFVPESGVSRATWARQRNDRLTRPEFIRIDVEGIQVLDEEGQSPRTVFTQTYTSDTFSDQVTKSLTWIRREGTWRIVTERSAP